MMYIRIGYFLLNFQAIDDYDCVRTKLLADDDKGIAELRVKTVVLKG